MLERMLLDIVQAAIPGIKIPFDLIVSIGPKLLEVYHRFADPVQRQAEIQAIALAALEPEGGQT